MSADADAVKFVNKVPKITGGDVIESFLAVSRTHAALGCAENPTSMDVNRNGSGVCTYARPHMVASSGQSVLQLHDCPRSIWGPTSKS